MITMILVTLYLATLTFVTIHAAIQFWPSHDLFSEAPVEDATQEASSDSLVKQDTAEVTLPGDTLAVTAQIEIESSEPTPDAMTRKHMVTVLWTACQVTDEIRLLYLVALLGALGSLVYAIRSFVYHIGGGSFNEKWFAWYLLKPFTGAGMALIFYLIIRGGFFTLDVSFDPGKPYGFAGLSVLVGMFVNQASEKLLLIANAIFKKPDNKDKNNSNDNSNENSEENNQE
jgi:hypothetical protein